MAVTWVLCDLPTGGVIEELPLKVAADLSSTVSSATTVGVTLDIHDESCPTNWASLIDPMRAMLVPVDDGHPLGVAYVIDADSYGDPSGTMTLNSIESILEAVYVRTYDFTEGVDDEATVAGTLLSDIIAAPLSVPGSFGFELDVTPTGISRDHSYAYEEDRTVGQCLTDLGAAQGGPEWTMRVRWEDDKHQRVIKTIQVAARIGVETASVIFEDVHMVSRIRNRSYARGNRAVHVIATGDGSGPDRPMSSPAVDVDALDTGVPQWEARLQTTGVDDQGQLDRIAAAGLQRRWQGVKTMEMQLALTAPGCPRPGRDFNAGDPVRIESGPQLNDPVPWIGPARVIGWRASVAGRKLTSVTPVFYEEPEEGSR